MIQEENDRILVARYIIEDNQEDYVYYNEGVENDIEITKSIFRQMVHDYKLWTPEEEGHLLATIRKAIGRNSSGIIQAMGLLDKTKSGYLQRKEIEDAFNTLDIHLSPQCLDYIYVAGHNLRRSADKAFKYKELIALFERPAGEGFETSNVNTESAAEIKPTAGATKVPHQEVEPTNQKGDGKNEYEQENFELENFEKLKEPQAKGESFEQQGSQTNG